MDMCDRLLSLARGAVGIGEVPIPWRILFNGERTDAARLLTDGDAMLAAYEISQSILGIRASSEEKADEFDWRMRCWCADRGVEVPGNADMNSIREVAYAAVRKRIDGDLHRLPVGNL